MVGQGIYPFKGEKLSRADVEWLLATHDNGRGPVNWEDESQREREGLDLRGADLSGANLQALPLARIIAGVNKEGANLMVAHLAGANFYGAYLERTNLDSAHLEGARLDKVFFDSKTRLDNVTLATINMVQSLLLMYIGVILILQL